MKKTLHDYLGQGAQVQKSLVSTRRMRRHRQRVPRVTIAERLKGQHPVPAGVRRQQERMSFRLRIMLPIILVANDAL